MADHLEQLKSKYQSVLNLIQQQNAHLENVNMQGDKLYVRASASSSDLKNKIWDQIKLVDPSYSDLIADIQVPQSSGASVSGATQATSARTYTVQPGDSLSKISKHFYGDANQYMKIVHANSSQISDPDKIKPGMTLNIP